MSEWAVSKNGSFNISSTFYITDRPEFMYTCSRFFECLLNVCQKANSRLLYLSLYFCFWEHDRFTACVSTNCNKWKCLCEPLTFLFKYTNAPPVCYLTAILVTASITSTGSMSFQETFCSKLSLSVFWTTPVSARWSLLVGPNPDHMVPNQWVFEKIKIIFPGQHVQTIFF